ncbi:hypothetical protein K440DRAFT_673978 [Wilcoxina mikolae CBS 423.85]|nr:hypothetical protein K440DRAFT_673978 [Wilcoxina mikolae CBS 423.85]
MNGRIYSVKKNATADNNNEQPRAPSGESRNQGQANLGLFFLATQPVEPKDRLMAFATIALAGGYNQPSETASPTGSEHDLRWNVLEPATRLSYNDRDDLAARRMPNTTYRPCPGPVGRSTSVLWYYGTEVFIDGRKYWSCYFWMSWVVEGGIVTSKGWRKKSIAWYLGTGGVVEVWGFEIEREFKDSVLMC